MTIEPGGDSTSIQSSVSAQACTSANRTRNSETNLQSAEGTDPFQTQTHEYTQAILAHTGRVHKGNNNTDSTIHSIHPISSNGDDHVTSRSMPITVESPPSAVHVHTHPATLSSSCSANQESGSATPLISSAARASIQTVGNTSALAPLPTASQQPLETVNANVLNQVVKLAAYAWEQLKPDDGNAQKYEIDLYRLLTSFEKHPQKEHEIPMIPELNVASSSRTNMQSRLESRGVCELESHSSSNSGVPRGVSNDVILSVPADSPPATTSRQLAAEQAVPPETIIVIDQSPEKISDTHNGASTLGIMNVHQPSTSTPITASDMKEAILLTTAESSLSASTESSFNNNSTLTEVTLEDSQFHDECSTPVPKRSKSRGMLKREISSEFQSTQSEHSAPPSKRPRTTDRNRPEAYKSTVNQAMDPTTVVIDDQEEENMMTNPAPSGRDSHCTCISQ